MNLLTKSKASPNPHRKGRQVERVGATRSTTDCNLSRGHLLIRGDARQLPIADQCVQCVVTSPPYFGMRSYLDFEDPAKAREIGIEPTLERYVASITEAFREVWRVLRDDGVVFLNLGDRYATPSGAERSGESAMLSGAIDGCRRKSPFKPGGMLKQIPGFKRKDRLGIPHRVMFALQDAGWYWRDEIVWSKTRPMTESVKDRTTKSHEFVFLLSKQPRYFYDHEAIKEPAVMVRNSRPYEDRNKRSVWTLCTSTFRGAHFAVMPPALAELCIKAGSRPGDVILDPFNGAGTTGLVSERLGRRYLGTDLSMDYLEMSARRIGDDVDHRLRRTA